MVAAGRRWMLTLSPGSIEEGGRGGAAAAKYEPLSCVFQEPRHTSVTLSGMWWRVKTCPNSVYTPVLLSLTEIFPLYVLQTRLKL